MMRYQPLALAMILSAGTALAQQAPEPNAQSAPASAPAAASVLAPAIAAPAAVGLPALPATPVAPAPTPAAAPDAASANKAPALAPEAALATASPPPADKVFSYGTAKNSLLFTGSQIEGMKKALGAYENLSNTMGNPENPDEAVILAPEKKVGEPPDYPVFYLSSILYHSPTDWTVWLDRTRITPANNNGELTVTQVTPDRVWFHWAPPYIDAIAARSSGNNFADAHKVSNRFTDPDTTKYTHGANAVEFSLKPNQSFVAGYFHTFEGKLPSPKVPGAATATPVAGDENGQSMSPQDAATINGLMGSPPSAADPMGMDRANMQQLIQNQSKVTPKTVSPTSVNP